MSSPVIQTAPLEVDRSSSQSALSERSGRWNGRVWWTCVLASIVVTSSNTALGGVGLTARLQSLRLPALALALDCMFLCSLCPPSVSSLARSSFMLCRRILFLLLARPLPLTHRIATFVLKSPPLPRRLGRLVLWLFLVYVHDCKFVVCLAAKCHRSDGPFRVVARSVLALLRGRVSPRRRSLRPRRCRRCLGRRGLD